MPTRSYLRRVDLIPFEGATDLHHRLARSFSLLTDWMGALTGHYDVMDVVVTLAHQTQAASVTFYRVDLASRRSERIIAHSRVTGSSEGATMSTALARFLLDHNGEDMGAGTIWRQSEVAKTEGFAGSDAARERDRHPALFDISLIVMEKTDRHCDLLEISFESAPNRSPELPSIIVTKALADVWTFKAPGVIDTLIAEDRRRQSAPRTSGVSIFDISNPYALTRAEIAVCRLLAAGQTPKEIAAAQNQSIATVRTHLRNLYSKTGTGGQVSLIALAQQERQADV
ncbi:helix-turn-helix transcriptional regulator [Thalassococcus sp. BH17M4-6]|uniref:helix-turn-helix transcriptional regulator n=1 Tax=Thalassococcus sp. BH17M4-6 TaxID=3413148 RepID=UPI003BC0AEEA